MLKPAPLQGSFSPGTGDEAAVTAPHCAVSVFGAVWLTLYWRGLIAYTRSSASHVIFSFMLQKEKFFGCPICLQNPSMGRAKQRLLLTSATGYRAIVPGGVA